MSVAWMTAVALRAGSDSGCCRRFDRAIAGSVVDRSPSIDRGSGIA